MDPIKSNTTGPSRVEERSRKAMKGKVRDVRAREESAVMDEEWVLCCQMISEAVV